MESGDAGAGELVTSVTKPNSTKTYQITFS
jgi:hypothetical protein